LQRAHLVARQPVGRLGRHLEVGVGVAHGLEEQALLDLAGDDCGAVVAAPEQAFRGVDDEIPFALSRFLAVALDAAIDQEGPDGLFEEVGVLLRAQADAVERGRRQECRENETSHGSRSKTCPTSFPAPEGCARRGPCEPGPPAPPRPDFGSGSRRRLPCGTAGSDRGRAGWGWSSPWWS